MITSTQIHTSRLTLDTIAADRLGVLTWVYVCCFSRLSFAEKSVYSARHTGSLFLSTETQRDDFRSVARRGSRRRDEGDDSETRSTEFPTERRVSGERLYFSLLSPSRHFCPVPSFFAARAPGDTRLFYM